MLHAIPSIDNHIRYSFDTIDIKSIYDKIKHQRETSRWTFMFVNHSSNECRKKKAVDIDKKFNFLWLRFPQTIDVSNRRQLLWKMMYPPPGAWNKLKELHKIMSFYTICCFFFENVGNFAKKLGITCYLGEQHCSVNLKMNRFILWVTMLLFAKNNWLVHVCDNWNKGPFKGSKRQVYEEIWEVLLA